MSRGYTFVCRECGKDFVTYDRSAKLCHRCTDESMRCAEDAAKERVRINEITHELHGFIAEVGDDSHGTPRVAINCKGEFDQERWFSFVCTREEAREFCQHLYERVTITIKMDNPHVELARAGNEGRE